LNSLPPSIRRFDVTVRNGDHELTDEEDTEDTRESGNDRTDVRIDETHRLQHQEEREHCHLRRDDHPAQEHIEKPILSFEMIFREGESRHGIEQRRDQRHRSRNDETVQEILHHIQPLGQREIMFERRRFREHRRRECPGLAGMP
jgi:hypothetical protein